MEPVRAGRVSRRHAIAAVSFGALTLAASYSWIKATLRPRDVDPGAHVFHVTVSSKGGISESPTFLVNQGDSVTLLMNSDIPGQANLHGYEKSISLKPGSAVSLSFTADMAGFYPLHLHEPSNSSAAPDVVMHRHLASVEVRQR